MTRSLIMMVAAAAMMSLTASAGTITGKVTGVSGASVVYVEAIAGKTFPAPTEQPVMAQRRLMFQPHILPVQQGGTVEFLNSDSVAHNVFWPSVGGNKKLAHNLGTWPQNEKRAFKFDAAGAGQAFMQCAPGDGGLHRRCPDALFCIDQRIRGIQDRERSQWQLRCDRLA